MDLTDRPGLKMARAGLAFNAVLGCMLGGLVVLSGPMMLAEGEELAVIVFGMTWGAVLVLLGLVGLPIAYALPHPGARIAARTLVLVQTFLELCFCGIVPGVGAAGVWIGLFIWAKRAAADEAHPPP